MACKERLISYLKDNGVHYTLDDHRTAYTAHELAKVEHVPGRQVAKVVMIIAKRSPVMVVMPATKRLSMTQIRLATNDLDARLAEEAEFAGAFPDCEVGAMPAFGQLYGVSVYVDESLLEDDKITFPAGSHREALTVTCSDFIRLTKPNVGAYATAA